jgi:hypothetical protein
MDSTVRTELSTTACEARVWGRCSEHDSHDIVWGRHMAEAMDSIVRPELSAAACEVMTWGRYSEHKRDKSSTSGLQ